jgi:hypothetical protein
MNKISTSLYVEKADKGCIDHEHMDIVNSAIIKKEGKVKYDIDKVTFHIDDHHLEYVLEHVKQDVFAHRQKGINIYNEENKSHDEKIVHVIVNSAIEKAKYTLGIRYTVELDNIWSHAVEYWINDFASINMIKGSQSFNAFKNRIVSYAKEIAYNATYSNLDNLVAIKFSELPDNALKRILRGKKFTEEEITQVISETDLDAKQELIESIERPKLKVITTKFNGK